MKSYIKNAIFIFIAATLILSLSKSLFEYKNKLNIYTQYQKETTKLKEERKNLQSGLKKNTDSSYLERQVREKLNLLKPGEKAIIIPQITIIPETTPTPTPPAYRQWINLFLN
jgi:cell division protein FtsB